jgi:hypothetical protein
VEQPFSSSRPHKHTQLHLQQTAHQLANEAAEMLEMEDNLLIPIVAHYIPTTEQSAFNNKVIRCLGILDSRLHLVGMHQAVFNLDNNDEIQIFEKTIPYIPRSMIPRWKRTLYDPKVSTLEGY